MHYIVFPELKKWHDAKADCERRGFYFAKIRNKAENDLLVEAIQRVYNGDRHDKKFHHENWVSNFIYVVETPALFFEAVTGY